MKPAHRAMDMTNQNLACRGLYVSASFDIRVTIIAIIRVITPFIE